MSRIFLAGRWNRIHTQNQQKKLIIFDLSQFLSPINSVPHCNIIHFLFHIEARSVSKSLMLLVLAPNPNYSFRWNKI
jgi:hypothetical protein